MSLNESTFELLRETINHIKDLILEPEKDCNIKLEEIKNLIEDLNFKISAESGYIEITKGTRPSPF